MSDRHTTLGGSSSPLRDVNFTRPKAATFSASPAERPIHLWKSFMSETTTTVEAGEAPALQREKLTKKAVTADHQVDRAVPCAMLQMSAEPRNI
jgi:hypothetical protein